MTEKPKEESVQQQALEEAVSPDVQDWDTFKVKLDNAEHTFEHRPFSFKWDMLFRKYALHVMGAQLKPIEALIAYAIKDDDKQMSEGVVDIGITRSLVESEVEADENLPLAVAVICASQDPKYKKGENKLAFVHKWQEVVEELSREQITSIFKKQVKVSKEVDLLGKSLRARFALLGELVGKDVNLSSLLPGLTLLAPNTLAQPGETPTTSSSSSGSSTESPATNKST